MGCGAEEEPVPGFDAEPAVGPAVLLEAESVDAERLTLRLVSTGVGELQGVAFRLAYDDGALRFSSFEAGSDWPAARLDAAREVTPGALWGAVGA
jgi:hypothetical protein